MAQDRSFKDGDLVRLKGGGPLMSVQFRVGDLLLCSWTDVSGRTRRGTFSADQMVSAADPEPVWVGVVAHLSSRFPVAATF